MTDQSKESAERTFLKSEMVEGKQTQNQRPVFPPSTVLVKKSASIEAGNEFHDLWKGKDEDGSRNAQHE